MTKYKVAIATRDPRTLYHAIRLMESLDIPFIICEPEDTKCTLARVVITCKDDASKITSDRLLILDEKLDIDSATFDFMTQFLELHMPRSFTIGIDPGMRYGLALLLDDSPLLTQEVISPFEAAKLTNEWVNLAKDRVALEPVIRVGNGSRLYMTLYLRALREIDGSPQIELVDEHHTTVTGGSNKSSAVLIASRSGKNVAESDYVLETKTGYIRSLKKLIRRLNNGSSNLSTPDAIAILKGDSSVREFVKSEVS
ncbi:MAG: hypothetical protein BAJATHORv1_20325 [Candidatus Thorarchaeota archaeon]|nr:MAG: hypothetical protein BAJATHORv1_20325 [Candidatus Thorarchaeota archaeon]